MKRILSILPCLLFYCIAASGQDEVLIWSDEFSVDGRPSSATWSYDVGNGGWGNNELETYTSSTDNSHVAGGLLYLDAIKTGGNWKSARLKSEGLANFTYGRIQFRAKLPIGSGTWPAMWLLGEAISTKGWPACGEIDVMEQVGKNPSRVQSAIHTPSSYGNTVNLGATLVSTDTSAFHTYELNWTPTKLEFSIDGKFPYYTYQPATLNSSTWPFANPCFLILNIAMGGNLGSDPKYETGGLKNGIDPALNKAEMQIDYIRVYQTVSSLPLTGPAVVDKNQTNLKYKFNNLPGATYTWTVPADAQIIAGDGTNQITVTWGQTDGDVSLSVTSNGNSFSKSLSVSQVVKPQGSIFPLKSPSSDVLWKVNPDNTNLYTILSQTPLDVHYTVTQKVSTPALTGTLTKGLDLTNYPILKVQARTANKSKSVNLRMDMVDENGNATSASPVFDFTPLIDDNEEYNYSFDFQNTNGWKSASGTVDKTRITGLNLYIDYGVYATIASDSVWIDSLWVEQTPAGTTIPNRPSGIAGVNGGKFTISWNDNSNNETGFKIYGATSANGTYTEISTAGADATSSVIPSGTNNLALLYYRVKSYNTAGLSRFSNILNPVDVVTGLSERITPGIAVYPNPTTGKLTIAGDHPAQMLIRICTMIGTEVMRLQSSLELIQIDLSPLAKGIYLLEISTNEKLTVEKVVLQ